MAESKPTRVLCVDDNVDVADSMVMMLEAVGYEVRARYSGRSALHEVEEFLPDACVLDLNMPGMDGDELAREIRRHVPGCHIVFVALTAMSTTDARERTQRAGFATHLVKPVDPAKLLAALPAVHRSEPRDGPCDEGALHEVRS